MGTYPDTIWEWDKQNKGQTPRNDTLFKKKKQELQWNLDVMNLYVMKSSL